MATIDYFLKLDGITGESADSKHKGEIEVLSFSFAESQVGPMGIGGGGGAGKVEMSDFSFTARTSKASPQLFQYCASGKHIKQALLTVRKAGQSQQEYLKIKLNDVLVSAYALDGEARGATARRVLAQLRQALVRLRAPEGRRLPRRPGARRLGQVEEPQDLKPPPSPPAAGSAARLREALASSGYTGAGIARRLHTTGEPIFTYVDLEVYRRRLAVEPDRLSMLIGLLLLGDDVPADDVADILVETGLAERRGGSLRGLVRVVPHDELLIASDRLDVEDADRVAGVHRPSATLAHLTVREPVERALDLCAGNGIQALLLSRHARHVVATDVNRRALAFAAFNFALNGVANVELREGSLLEPVSASASAASPAIRPTSSRQMPCSPSATAVSRATGSASYWRAG